MATRSCILVGMTHATASSMPTGALRTAVHEVVVVFKGETRQVARFASHDAAVARAERMAAGDLPESVVRTGKPIDRIEIRSRLAIYPAVVRAPIGSGRDVS